ncbi:aspartate racemase [Cribrihabitans marinus]|uniref:Aspartate racemase n=1 Tax=Cribrihabitans marinus TaxID=1227549 RepID=A0A1H6SVF7_9RHOB|nr:amino acid racemase [Cribrihabitans marinus]GGH22775.1 aspartate racemase [Cribrihabitans marinus]SEI71903.1 aspartate racemase [Cribrihabitans marinus]
MRAVGILGGMGPEATILLMQKVLAAVPARDDADHVPLIVHQNPQVPSRIAALIQGTGDDPGPVLAAMAGDLERAGARALAMPCNTAHHYADAVRAATGLPFLDMLELTAAHLAGQGARRIGLLASPAVRLTGVFDPSFAAHDLRAEFPRDDSAVLALIRAVKAGQAADAAILMREARALIQAGCEQVLIACTELSLSAQELPADIHWTDSLDCLAHAIVAFAAGD